MLVSERQDNEEGSTEIILPRQLLDNSGKNLTTPHTIHVGPKGPSDRVSTGSYATLEELTRG